MPDQQPITPQELAALVTPASELSKLALKTDKRLTLDETADVLSHRIIDGLPQGVYDAMTMGNGDLFGGRIGTTFDADLARIIAGALPEKLRTATVLGSIDLRPYLEALNGKNIAGVRKDTGWTNAFGLGRIEQAYDRPFNTTPLIEAETKRISTSINADPETDTVDLTTYKPGKAGIVPTPVATETDANGNLVPSSAQTGVGGMIDTDGDGVPDTFAPSSIDSTVNVTMPIEDMRNAVQMRLGDLESLAKTDQAYQVDYPGQHFPVQMDRPQPKGPIDATTGKPKTQLNLQDAMQYLQKLSPDEVRDMQTKLAAAGYFDQLGNDGRFLSGDAFDENTQAAWNLLLTDSVRTKKPVTVILGEKVKSYREEARASRLQGIAKIDPTYVNSVANDFGQSVIGRDLTPDEQGAVIQHLRSLVSQRAGHVAGTGDGSTMLPNEEGFTGSDIQNFLGADPGVHRERVKTNTQALDYKLSKLMGG